MTTDDALPRFVRGVLDSDATSVRESRAELAPTQIRTAVAAAMAVVVDRYLGDDVNPMRVDEVSRMIFDRYADKQQVPPMAVDTVLRGVLGEEELLRSAPEEWVVPTQMLIAHALGTELATWGVGRDELVASAVELVAETLPTDG